MQQSRRYLSIYKNILADRTSIQAGNQRWYELVRKRDESWLTRPKLLIRDLATETSFAIDASGNTFLVGGTAIVPANYDQLSLLLGYLNSGLANWYLNPITPSFRADFQKFEPQHLQNIPIPQGIFEDDNREEIESLVSEILEAKQKGDFSRQQDLEERITSLVCKIAGIDRSELS